MHLAFPGLRSKIESGATLVTPNRLLAQLALHDYSSACLKEGRESWLQPPIYSSFAWLSRCWQTARYAGSDVPVLLKNAQEQSLWQQIIERENPGLFDIQSTAALASRAASLVAEWDIPLEHDAWNEHEDGRHFRNWLRTFQKLCGERGWIDRAALWRLVPKWIAAGWCEAESVAFVGFPHRTPALMHLRETLGSRCELPDLEQSRPGARVAAKCCDNLAEEIETAARWSRASFEADPASSIGVFVPDLSANRSIVERIFNQVFYSGRAASRLIRNSDVEFDSVFHLHAGAPLIDQPLITGAMMLLQLANPRIPIAEASAILRSPWLTAADAERNARSLADFQLRRSRELDVTLRDLDYSAKACPEFQKLLRHVRATVNGKPARAEFAAWSEFISDLLAAAGWPGDRELSAAEQDVVEAWKDSLSTMASLTFVSPRVPFEEAILRLKSLLSEKTSEAGDFFSPIQILDCKDSAGFRFNEAFVVGLSEGNAFWDASTSPLIPLRLQRMCEIPGSSPNQLRDLREKSLRDLFSVAPSISATYSKRLLPAAQPFVSIGEGFAESWAGRTPKQAFSHAELESLEDTNAPPYQPGDASLGGSGLLKDQSQCPFRAFAIRRLNARSPEEGSFGLDPMDRGTFAHDALKQVWSELKTQAALHKYPGLELQFLVTDAVKNAVQTKATGPLHEELTLAERDRLAEIILDWLEVELDRKQPFQVETTEQERVLEIAGLHLNIRIDRIDSIAGGKKLLIDYKSGETKVSNLDGDRPKEPQLLAYAASMRDEVAGIFFGQLMPRKPRLLGYAPQQHSEKRHVRKDWDEYLQGRLAVVERLAASFVAGEAAVDPFKDACSFCRLPAFCRVNEVRREKEGDDGDD